MSSETPPLAAAIFFGRTLSLGARISFAVCRVCAKAMVSVKVSDSSSAGLASMMPTWTRRPNSYAAEFLNIGKVPAERLIPLG